MHSILVGAAANLCFGGGKAVTISELVRGLTAPNAAPMPDRSTKIPMPVRI